MDSLIFTVVFIQTAVLNTEHKKRPSFTLNNFKVSWIDTTAVTFYCETKNNQYDLISNLTTVPFLKTLISVSPKSDLALV